MTYDHQGINNVTVALGREMMPQNCSKGSEPDVLFVGGAEPTEAQALDLVSFGLRKNYHLVFAAFDPASPQNGPITLTLFATDGHTQAVTLRGCRLWKRNRQTPSVLLVPDDRVLVKVSSKRRLVIRQMKGTHDDRGFELAQEALLARAASQPGRAAILGQIGSMIVVQDVEAFIGTMQAAA